MYESSTKGLFNVTRCAATGPGTPDASGRVVQEGSDVDLLKGPPMYFSLPHFCDADPAIAAQTEGVSCDRTLHDLQLGVEPISGATVVVNKRLQLASEFDARYSMFDSDVSPTTLPILWVDETAEAPEYDLDAVRKAHRVRPTPHTTCSGPSGPGIC
jgi:hypothetical protein